MHGLAPLGLREWLQGASRAKLLDRWQETKNIKNTIGGCSWHAIVGENGVLPLCAHRQEAAWFCIGRPAANGAGVRPCIATGTRNVNRWLAAIDRATEGSLPGSLRGCQTSSWRDGVAVERDGVAVERDGVAVLRVLPKDQRLLSTGTSFFFMLWINSGSWQSGTQC